MVGRGSIASPRIAVMSSVEVGVDRAVDAEEVVVDLLRRRKMAEGLSLESLGWDGLVMIDEGGEGGRLLHSH
jgi:hypothetical protein